jgi:hypothetical protein
VARPTADVAAPTRLFEPDPGWRLLRATVPVDCGGMDYQSAASELRDYLQRVQEVAQMSGVTLFNPDKRFAVQSPTSRLGKINSILAVLTPDAQLVSASTLTTHQSSVVPVVKLALKLIENTVALESAWDGIDVPFLPMNALDPLIYSTAIGQWKHGHYRQAVIDAASALNKFTQSRVGRYDISDRELMCEVFKNSPPKPGEPRLVCLRHPSTETFKAQQDGAKLYAMGCYELIRDPAVHETGDWNPITAFKYLTALSIVAEKVRTWRLDKYVPPLPDSAEISALVAQVAKAGK